jgi:GT2 family glycosyltransferase
MAEPTIIEDVVTGPAVSVVIPCYNAAKFIKRTIVSVLRNTYRPLEIIVVDDGSKDDSVAVLKAVQARFPEVKIFEKENGGVSSARNHGIRQATSDYIALLDADDLFYPDSLAKRMRIFIEEDESSLLGVYCPVLVVDEKGNPLMRQTMFNWSTREKLYYSFSSGCQLIPSCSIIKKSKMMESGLFDETVCPAEDYDLWLKMLRRGGYFRLVRNCLIGWVQHENSATHNQILHHQRQVKKVVRRVFEPDASTPVKEYQKGYGEMMFYETLSEQSFYSANMAVAAGDLEVAREITRDVSYFYLQRMDAYFFERTVRNVACRALCKPEDAWLTEIWPPLRGQVCEYFEFLQRYYETDLPVLKVALKLLDLPANLNLAVK